MMSRTEQTTIGLWDIIDHDFGTFLDTISEKAFGTTRAVNIEFRLVQVVDDRNLIIEVTADMEDNDQ